MAKKELIIIILVTIIIGLSIAVALNVVKEHSRESNRDMIRQELLHVAGNAQSFYNRPERMGGGNGSFLNIGYTDLGVDSISPNGTYLIRDVTHESFYISGVTKDGADTVSAIIEKSGIIWD